MRINAQPISKTTIKQYDNQASFKAIIDVPMNTDETVYISSPYKPKAILWYDDDGKAFYDNEPKYRDSFAAEFQVGRYYTLNKEKAGSDFNPTQAAFIPSDELAASRFIDELNIPITTKTDTASLFNYLNLKLENLNNSVSTWDSFNIYRVVYNREELSAALSSLPLSSSIIINVDDYSLTVGEWNVIKGDMIIKDKDGALHHLKGSVGGFYYPSQIIEATDQSGSPTGLLQIKFAYSQENPISNSDEIIKKGDSALGTPAEKITLTIPEVDTKNNVAYSIHKTVSAGGTTDPQQFLTKGNTKIHPIVYCYLNGERVYFPSDYSIDENDSGKFVIKNLSAFNIDCEVR